MTALDWDVVGQRFYETGVDRGVLYLPDGSGIPWNGLTGVVEEFGDYDTTPRYLDGVKYLDDVPFTDFSGTLTALTYPDEFLEMEGSLDLGNGLSVDNQASKQFGLTYRTLVGNDVNGSDHAYKIHILYNLTAVVSDDEHGTLTDVASPLEFSWGLTSTPMSISGYRPTAHIIFDSRYLDPNIIHAIEFILYGGRAADPRLPTVDDFLDLIANWDPRIIIPHTDTGLADLVSGLGDLTRTVNPGIYTILENSRLVPSGVNGLFHLS
jgi:hypothetical protein